VLSRWSNVKVQINGCNWTTLIKPQKMASCLPMHAGLHRRHRSNTGAIPSITSLLTSNYLDLDAPNPDLYPQGTLLFNTRRSGFNVKSFQVDYFNPAIFQ
jgi:hypothetical protein